MAEKNPPAIAPDLRQLLDRMSIQTRLFDAASDAAQRPIRPPVMPQVQRAGQPVPMREMTDQPSRQPSSPRGLQLGPPESVTELRPTIQESDLPDTQRPTEVLSQVGQRGLAREEANLRKPSALEPDVAGRTPLNRTTLPQPPPVERDEKPPRTDAHAATTGPRASAGRPTFASLNDRAPTVEEADHALAPSAPDSSVEHLEATANAHAQQAPEVTLEPLASEEASGNVAFGELLASLSAADEPGQIAAIELAADESGAPEREGEATPEIPVSASVETLDFLQVNVPEQAVQATPPATDETRLTGTSMPLTAEPVASQPEEVVSEPQQDARSSTVDLFKVEVEEPTVRTRNRADDVVPDGNDASLADAPAPDVSSSEDVPEALVSVDIPARLTIGGPHSAGLDVRVVGIAPGSVAVVVPTVELLPINVTHRLSLMLPGTSRATTLEARILEHRPELDEQGNSGQYLRLRFTWTSDTDRDLIAGYCWSLTEGTADPMQPVSANVKIEVMEGERNGLQILGKSSYAGKYAVQCTVEGFDVEPSTQVRFTLIAPRFVDQMTLEDGVVARLSPSSGRRMEVQIEFANPHKELMEFVAKYFSEKPAGGLPFLSRFRR